MQVFDASCGISMMARSAKKYENDVVAWTFDYAYFHQFLEFFDGSKSKSYLRNPKNKINKRKRRKGNVLHDFQKNQFSKNHKITIV